VRSTLVAMCLDALAERRHRADDAISPCHCISTTSARSIHRRAGERGMPCPFNRMARRVLRCLRTHDLTLTQVARECVFN
jgi:hypothetical protein